MITRGIPKFVTMTHKLVAIHFGPFVSVRRRISILCMAALFIILCISTGKNPADSFAQAAKNQVDDPGGDGGMPAGQPQDRQDLESIVAKLLQGDQVLMRREINKVFELANIYAAEGKEDRAIQLYEKALEVNAANIPAQMELATLLHKKGRKTEAIEKAAIVQEFAEDGDLIEKSEALLKSLGRPTNSTETSSQTDKNVEIDLIPIGDVNPIVLRTLRDKLEQKMGTTFKISPSMDILGSPDRTYKEVFLRDYIGWLKQRIGETKFPAVLSELGFNLTDLNSSENRLKFIYSLFEHSGVDSQKAREMFDAELAKSEAMKQYDEARLCQVIQTKYPLPEHSSVKGYLAITSVDLYEGESRFRFGGALPGYGIMSLRRFTSAFNNEDQNRPRLVTRALKQTLSSANFVLGIPRCSNPNCARAYPSSLPELDQKPDELCSLCKERLSAYRQAAVAPK